MDNQAELLAAVEALVGEFNTCGDDKDQLAEVKPRLQESVFALLWHISAENVSDAGAAPRHLGLQ